MLAELVVDMPDMLEDFKEWSPKHYKDHFRESGVADKELAIDAYDVSPQEYKDPFESTIALLNRQITILQKKLESEKNSLGSHENSAFISAKCELIRGLIDRAGGVINGHISESRAPGPAETVVETAAEKVENETHSNVIEVSEGEMLDQSDIDALFD